MSGWIGTPDPAKFAQGTNYLSPQDLAIEVKKGNVIVLEDAVKILSELDEWEKKAVMDALREDFVSNRFFVTLEDGSRVSFGDLSRYVHDNPELKALADPKAGINVRGTGGYDPQPVGSRIAPDLYDPSLGEGEDGWPLVDLEAAQQMRWGIVAKGGVFNKRPNRWLWGLGGDLAATFAVYVHEDRAHELLGPKYGGIDPREALSNKDYAKDIIKAGPMMGMSFMITAVKDISLSEASEAWAARMLRRLQDQASSLPPPPSLPANDSEDLDRHEEGIASLLQVCSLASRPDILMERTQLLNPTDQSIKAGSTLLVSTSPDGDIVIHGMSPGVSYKDRETYLLGSVNNLDLAQALVSDFLSPLDPIDPDLIEEVKKGMLVYANGFKADNTNNHPHARRGGEGPGFSMTTVPASCDLFRLPRVGSGQPSPLLLDGVREMVVTNTVGDLYQKAFEAGLSTLLSSEAEKGNTSGQVPTVLDKEAQEAWHKAAKAALIKGLDDLPPEVRGIKEDIMGRGIFAASRPLQEDQGQT